MSDVRKLTEVTRKDVRDLVDAVGDGIIPAVDLYAKYVEMMAAQGREPGTRAMLGRAIGQAGQRPLTRSVDGKTTRCWSIKKEFLYWLGPDLP